MKVLIHDGLGIWLCARRLNRGKFHWRESWRGDQLRLTDEQFPLVKGLPWQRLGAAGVISVLWLQAERSDHHQNGGVVCSDKYLVRSGQVNCRVIESSRWQWLGILFGMSQRPDFNQLSIDQIRALAADQFDRMENKDRALIHRDAVIAKLIHEVAMFKRHKYAQHSEQLDAVHGHCRSAHRKSGAE